MPPEIALNSVESDIESSKERKLDMVWILSLYGTAIGAGTLFLPIDAGLNGIWPLLIMALLALPMTYYSHQALCRFVISGSGHKNNITDVVDEHFGAFNGKILTILYFFSIFPIILMYSVALTNTTQSFMIHQLHITPPPRALLSLALIAALMSIVRFGQASIIKVMSTLVYPFILTLILFSIYLIPHWNTALFHEVSPTHSGHGFLMTLWLVIPVMVFSFNHLAIISSFAVSQKERFGDDVDGKSSRLLKIAHVMMVGTVMLFVFSCALSLSPHDLAEAKQQNISILSYLANHFETPLIAYVAPLIAFVAISKSFLGHYLGAAEGLHGVLMKTLPPRAKELSNTKIRHIIEVFIVLSCWITATLNPNILKMIESLGGPITALILFIMPMYAINTVPALKRFKKRFSTPFIITMGLVALSAILYGVWETIH